jgi:hypothetical protein
MLAYRLDINEGGVSSLVAGRRYLYLVRPTHTHTRRNIYGAEDSNQMAEPVPSTQVS